MYVCMYIYIYIYRCVCVYVYKKKYIYIYIYIERERERVSEREYTLVPARLRLRPAAVPFAIYCAFFATFDMILCSCSFVG